MIENGWMIRVMVDRGKQWVVAVVVTARIGVIPLYHALCIPHYNPRYNCIVGAYAILYMAEPCTHGCLYQFQLRLIMQVARLGC